MPYFPRSFLIRNIIIEIDQDLTKLQDFLYTQHLFAIETI